MVRHVFGCFLTFLSNYSSLRITQNEDVRLHVYPCRRNDTHITAKPAEQLRREYSCECQFGFDILIGL